MKFIITYGYLAKEIRNMMNNLEDKTLNGYLYTTDIITFNGINDFVTWIEKS